jgi:hypothetical protein
MRVANSEDTASDGPRAETSVGRPASRDLATMKDGMRVSARDGVKITSIVRIDREDEQTFVRSHRWTRYREEDRRARVSGYGRTR